MAAPADPSLLAAELGGGEGGGEEALRRLLQLPPDEDGGGPPPTGPSRAVTPQPGLCVKTLSGGAKFFVNVCHAPEVPPPPPLPPPPALRRLLASPDPGAFRIPMSLGEPHQERDRGGQPCTAYDVVINSDFFRTLQADPLYLEFFLTVAMEGLGEKYGVELGQTGWRLLRHRRFMGTPGVQRIRARPQIQELDGPPAAPPRPPLWVVLAQPSAQRPRVLQARVLLPQLEGADSLSLQLSEDLLVLGGHRGCATAAGGSGGGEGDGTTGGGRGQPGGGGAVPSRAAAAPSAGHGAHRAHHRLLPTAAPAAGAHRQQGRPRGAAGGARQGAGAAGGDHDRPAPPPPPRTRAGGSPGAPAAPPGPPGSPGHAAELRPGLGVRPLHGHHPPAALGAGTGTGAEPPVPSPRRPPGALR